MAIANETAKTLPDDGPPRAPDRPADDSGPARVHHALPARADGARAPAADLGGARRRPQARAHRGRARTRFGTPTPSGERLGRDRVRAATATGSSIEVNDDGEGFDPAEDGRPRRPREPDRGRPRHRDHPRDRRRVRARRAAPGGRGSRSPLRQGPHRLSRRLLQLVNVGHKSLADYASLATRGLMDEIRALAEPLAGQARAAPLRDGVRRRRRGDQLHARPADAGRRPRRRVADHPRRRRLLQRHEDDPQRAAGRPARADATRTSEIFRRYQELNARELEPTTTTS